MILTISSVYVPNIFFFSAGEEGPVVALPGQSVASL